MNIKLQAYKVTLNKNLNEQYPFLPVVINHKFELIHRQLEDMWGKSHTPGKLFLDYLSDFLNSFSTAMQLFVMENS